MLHLGSLPQRNRENWGALPAIFYYEDTYSYAEFEALVGRFAQTLQERYGIRRGDVVAVNLYNRVEFAIAMFAAWRIGAALTPINPALKADEVAYQLQDSGARVVFFEKSVAGATRGALNLIGSEAPVPVILDGGEEDGEDRYEQVLAEDALPTGELDFNDIALIIYTSGTTGRPKGVLLTHFNVADEAQQLIAGMTMSQEDRSLLLLPLFHVNGIMVTLVNSFMVGATVVIRNRFVPQEFFPTVHRYRPTFFSAVPTIYQVLLSLPDEMVKDYDTSSIRFALCGAAPMPVETYRRFEERFGIKIIEGYGLSEGTVCSTVNPLDGVRKVGSIGLPLVGQDVRIFDDHDVEVPTGVVGEIVVQGQNVMKGYLNRPEETAKTLKNGWLHTGDLGYKDEDGYIFIVDRKKDMILRGGENVYPKEIEDVIYKHPAIQEAAVIGVPDEKYGQEVHAIVVVKPGMELTEESLIAFCREQMANYKCPKSVRFVTELPKNSVGKITKNELREMAKETF